MKVSEIVHEEIESRKDEGETFDDVLKRELDLLPDLDDLTAYFSPDLADAAEEVVEAISQQGDFSSEIVEENHYYALNFISPDSDRIIAQCRFTEDQMKVYYRDQHGDLTHIGWVDENDEGEVGCYVNVRYEGIEEIKERAQEKVTGAYRKWG